MPHPISLTLAEDIVNHRNDLPFEIEGIVPSFEVALESELFASIDADNIDFTVQGSALNSLKNLVDTLCRTRSKITLAFVPPNVLSEIINLININANPILKNKLQSYTLTIQQEDSITSVNMSPRYNKINDDLDDDGFDEAFDDLVTVCAEEENFLAVDKETANFSDEDDGFSGEEFEEDEYGNLSLSSLLPKPTVVSSIDAGTKASVELKISSLDKLYAESEREWEESQSASVSIASSVGSTVDEPFSPSSDRTSANSPMSSISSSVLQSSFSMYSPKKLTASKRELDRELKKVEQLPPLVKILPLSQYGIELNLKINNKLRSEAQSTRATMSRAAELNALITERKENHMAMSHPHGFFAAKSRKPAPVNLAQSALLPSRRLAPVGFDDD